jgi:hypothetical protein
MISTTTPVGEHGLGLFRNWRDEDIWNEERGNNERMKKIT